MIPLIENNRGELGQICEHSLFQSYFCLAPLLREVLTPGQVISIW
jgi:hypothetical protein